MRVPENNTDHANRRTTRNKMPSSRFERPNTRNKHMALRAPNAGQGSTCDFLAVVENTKQESRESSVLPTGM